MKTEDMLLGKLTNESQIWQEMRRLKRDVRLARTKEVRLVRLEELTPHVEIDSTQVGFTVRDVLSWDDAVLDIDNDGSETAIFNYTVPGGTLGTTDAIGVLVCGNVKNQSGAAKTSVVRLKYGATTIESFTFAIADGFGQGHALIWCHLAANGSESAQVGSIGGTLGTNDSGKSSGVEKRGTAAEDSTGDLSLQITWDFNAADADLEYHRYWYEVEEFVTA